MAEVLFYHLVNTPLEQVLPLLVARTRERNQRSIIRGGSEERLRVLDDALWTYDDASFLPHGLWNEPQPEGQPVLLTPEDGRPNDAEVLFLIDAAPLPAAWDFTRVVVLFDDADEDAKTAARAQWKEVRAMGHDATYWQQDETGRWVKKA
jgi:DNA polymerase-3 subunit chi